MDRITALYVRVSTEEQAREGYSIENQVDRLSAYAKFQGWQNVEIFADEGRSAKDMNRPEMKRLIKLIKQDKVSIVATLFVDRLSRNLLDMLQFVELCEKHNTAYVCAALNFDTSTPIGRMVLQILAAFAEFENSMKATTVKSNMTNIVEKKKRYLALPPFGYEFDEHKNLVIVPEEAEWIQKAADMFIAGHGYRAVAKWLNDNGLTTKKGVSWTASTVRQMLTNELYIGQLIWNRRYYDKNGKMHWRDPSEWITHENAHPAILSDEQWAEINKRITRRMPKGGQKQSKYRLSGLMRCGYCGATMVSRRYGNKGPHKNKFIFVCSDYQKNGGCRFNYIFVDEADRAVYETLENLSNGFIHIPEEDLSKAAQAREIDFARREAVIDQKFQRQIQAFENGLISERDLKIARERVERERQLLLQEKERAKLPEKNEIREIIQKEAKQLLWLWDNGELPVIQNTLRTIIDSIVVLDGQVVDIKLSEELFSPV
ncbi:MAG: recombinase family protein [Thermoanaerobacterium sp.]|nr:recombinase family protein [Thermoanaerobacterium sp.]